MYLLLTNKFFQGERIACVTFCFYFSLPHHMGSYTQSLEDLSLFLEGGCCYAMSLSRLKIVPTCCFGASQHFNAALAFLLASRSCFDMGRTMQEVELFLVILCIFFGGASFWNSLPQNIKSCISLPCFKRNLHKYMSDNNLKSNLDGFV